MVMRKITFLCASLLAICLHGTPSGAADALPATIEFNRDIRPILSDNCYQCHGPDQAKRKADLRLDTEAGALADRKHKTLVPGRPEKSELHRRITSTDDNERMPAAASGKKLSPRQIALVKAWIEQGA